MVTETKEFSGGSYTCENGCQVYLGFPDAVRPRRTNSCAAISCIALFYCLHLRATRPWRPSVTKHLVQSAGEYLWQSFTYGTSISLKP
jgi:hypothetical protein